MVCSLRSQFRHFFLLTLLLMLGVAHAELPNRGTGFVTDGAGALDNQTRLQLESLLVDLNRKTSAEVAVVTVSSLEGQEISDVAVDLFQKWGIGKKGKDNGVLFLISPQDRKVRIEVGYGLEGILPDGYTGRILDQAVLPSFKEGALTKGIAMGTLAIAQTIAKDSNVQLSMSRGVPSQRQAPRRKASLLEKILGIVFIIIMIPIVIRHPWLLFFLLAGGRGGGGFSGGGFGGGFGGFGGGLSGGGGASRGW